MNTTSRFNNAVQQLYIAFHKGQLIPESCTHCAVGNICNQTATWAHFTNLHGSKQLNYVGRVHQQLGRRYFGYSPLELLQIEVIFLKACGFNVPLKANYNSPKLNTDRLFKGLTAVVKYLCLLDNIPNVMYSSVLFQYVPNEKLVTSSTEF